MKETGQQLKNDYQNLLEDLDKRKRNIRKSILFIICASFFLFASQNIFLDSLGISEGMKMLGKEGALKFLFFFMFVILLPFSVILGGFFFWYLAPVDRIYKLRYAGEEVPEELYAKGMKRFRRFIPLHNIILVLMYLLQMLPGIRMEDKNLAGIILDLLPKFNMSLELMIFSWIMIEFFALRSFRLTMGIYHMNRKPSFLRKNTTQIFFIPLLFVINSLMIMVDAVLKMFMGTVSRFQVHRETLGNLLGQGSALGGDGGTLASSGSLDALSTGDPQQIVNLVKGLTLLAVISIIPAIAVFLAMSLLQRGRFRNLEEKISELAMGSGDLTKKISIQSEDELAFITSHLNDFIENLRQKLLLLSQSAGKVMASNNTMHSHLENTSAATEEMVASVNQINRTTASRTETISQTGESLLSVVASLDSISASVENQAAFVDQTSSAINEMAASISSVSHSTRKASELSSHLRTAAKDGEKAVTDSIGAVRAVENSSEEVNSLVTLITETADTTNLLAMNAAIEAAHAGEAGKGFAVVAEEVRRLAEDSSEGARQITGQIQTMVDVVGKGVQLSEEAGASLARVIQDVEETSRVMDGIALAMDEQNAGAGEILKSITSLVDATSTIREVAAEQKQKNEEMRHSVDMIIQAFNEIKMATGEQSQGTQEIVQLITALQDVARDNQQVVETLQKAFSGFKL